MARFAAPALVSPDVLMTVEETARYLKITGKSVYNMIYDGRLPAVRLGRNLVRLRKSDVDAALKPVISRD